MKQSLTKTLLIIIFLFSLTQAKGAVVTLSLVKDFPNKFVFSDGGAHFGGGGCFLSGRWEGMENRLSCLILPPFLLLKLDLNCACLSFFLTHPGLSEMNTAKQIFIPIIMCSSSTRLNGLRCIEFGLDVDALSESLKVK